MGLCYFFFFFPHYTFIDNRHPEAQARPTFKDILLQLLSLEGDAALKVPEEDSATHKLASLIGGPLEAGEKLYTDLQWKYFTADEHEQQL